ncbi:MAG: cell division protein FtsQ/DivIB [Oscillospiraceae bacterium]
MKQSKQPRQRRARRVRRPSAGRGRSLLQPLIFLLICVALVLGMSVFFRVSKVEVVGNSIYTAEEVVDASGIGKGDNLFFINRFSAASRIFSKLPYVDKAKVTRACRTRHHHDQESSAMATSGGRRLRSLTSCKLLSPSRTDALTSSPASTASRRSAKVGGAQSRRCRCASHVPRRSRAAASRHGIKVTVIDLADAASPSFLYDGRFTVRLGANENVEYKFGMLQSAISQLTAGDTGTIDLSIDKRAHFSPG